MVGSVRGDNVWRSGDFPKGELHAEWSVRGWAGVGQMWAVMGRYWKGWAGVGRCGQMWADVGRCGQV